MRLVARASERVKKSPPFMLIPPCGRRISAVPFGSTTYEKLQRCFSRKAGSA
jgi:hypothetical protein